MSITYMSALDLNLQMHFLISLNDIHGTFLNDYIVWLSIVILYCLTLS